MTIPALAAEYKLPVSRLCDEFVVKGKNGHLFCDGGVLCVCFTDDGREEPFEDGRLAAGARKQLGSALKVTQVAQNEWVGRILCNPSRSLVSKLKRILEIPSISEKPIKKKERAKRAKRSKRCRTSRK